MAQPRTSPGTVPILEPAGGTWVENSYIVKLKSGHSKNEHMEWLRPLMAEHNSQITHGEWHPDAFHGYAANLTPSIVKMLRARHDVEYIEKNMESQDEADMTAGDGDDDS